MMMMTDDRKIYFVYSLVRDNLISEIGYFIFLSQSTGPPVAFREFENGAIYPQFKWRNNSFGVVVHKWGSVCLLKRIRRQVSTEN
jgi:hypothetical protein